MAKPSKTRAQRQHLAAVASLGCVVCRNLGFGPSPAEIHHVRTGQGMGQRASHYNVLPLCPVHHRAAYPSGFHANPRGWQRAHGAESDLLIQITADLARMRAYCV
ncbi:MAG: Ref family recombination enhancement nuclease [Aeromonas sp.]